MKYILTLIMFIFTVISAKAEIAGTIYAVTPCQINSSNIKVNETIKLITAETSSSKLGLKEGEIIEIKIKEYVKPKRGKKDGYFKAEYKTMNVVMRPSNPKDMKSMVKKAEIIIAGHILKIPGFSQAAAVSKGIINPNENQTRLYSAGKNLYESTPLTYIEKGKDFDVDSDGIVVLKLKQNNKKK